MQAGAGFCVRGGYMERQSEVRACMRERGWVQNWVRLVATTGTELGRIGLAKGTDSGPGTKTIGETQSTGFKVGMVKAIDGIPGPMESQVEQTLDRGWALRPEPVHTAEVENDRKRGAEWALAASGRGNMLAGDSNVAEQLVKFTW